MDPNDFITLVIAWVAARCTLPCFIIFYLCFLCLCFIGFIALTCWVLSLLD